MIDDLETLENNDPQWQKQLDEEAQWDREQEQLRDAQDIMEEMKHE